MPETTNPHPFLRLPTPVCFSHDLKNCSKHTTADREHYNLGSSGRSAGRDARFGGIMFEHRLIHPARGFYGSIIWFRLRGSLGQSNLEPTCNHAADSQARRFRVLPFIETLIVLFFIVAEAVNQVFKIY